MAEGVISDGVRKVFSGLKKLKIGSMYWKGSFKKRIKKIAEGNRILNNYQETASIIGSSLSSGMSVLKSFVKGVFGL